MSRSLYGFVLLGLLSLMFLSACNETGETSSSSEQSSGQSVAQGQRGSTARMALIDNYLYAISGDIIQLFNLEQGDSPQLWTTVQLDFGIETLFPYGNYLLVGADDGVYILDNSDRAAPVLIGEFIHATAVDPVVAKDNLAYVTLSRNPADFPNENTDRIDVVDISNPADPTLIYTVDMRGPRGLTIDGNRLHVCDGEAGIKTFLLDNPQQPELDFTLPNDLCTDMLMVNGNLVTVGTDGISQYDVTTGRPMKMSELKRETLVYLLEP